MRTARKARKLDHPPQEQWEHPFQKERSCFFVGDIDIDIEQAKAQRQKTLSAPGMVEEHIMRLRDLLRDQPQKAIVAKSDVVYHFLRNVGAVESRIRRRTLDAKFRRLVRQWKRDTSHISSIRRRAMHLAYQSIIGMGPEAVPLILDELKQQPDDWFWALHVITGVDPVPEQDRGNIEMMAEAWLEWGRGQGFEV